MHRCEQLGVILGYILAAPVVAQPDLMWVEQFGTEFQDLGYAVAPDNAGGVFIAGSCEGELGGPYNGGADCFLARYDGAGSRIWITQFGTDGIDRAYDLVPDGTGGVFVAGTTERSLGGPNAGGFDVFLARYNGIGHQAWITQFGASGTDVSRSLARDGAGGVFITGNTHGGLDGPGLGWEDVFLARFDGAGNQAWMTQFGTTEPDLAGALSPDGAGGVFLAGATYGKLGAENPGGEDIFLARHDSAGQQAWIVQFGSGTVDQAPALSPDGTGGVFIAGWTFGSLGGPNAGGWDVFLARRHASGEQAWVTQLGTDVGDYLWGLAPDSSGGVFVAGTTHGSLGGPEAGRLDIFLAGYDANGQPSWITQIGTGEDDSVRAIVPGGNGGVFFSGETEGAFDDLNAGGHDVILGRFGTACYPDLDDSGALDLFDFLAFTNLFNAADPKADCDADGGFTLFDFLCFTNAFNAGC